MWNWIKSNWPPLAAILGALALVFVTASAELEQNRPQEQSNTNQEPSYAQEAPKESFSITPVEGGGYVVERYAAHDEEAIQWPFHWPWTAEDWMAGLTLALVASTIGLWWATYQLGERAATGMRRLERAYVHISIGGEDPEHGLQAFGGAPKVEYRATNNGKTPAFIGGIEGALYLEGVGAGGRIATDEPQLLRQTVLGADKKTDWLKAEVRLIDAEKPMERFNAGEGTLRLRVIVTYADIWDNWYSEETWATFDRNRRRWNITRNEYPVIDGKVKYPKRS